MKNKLIIGTLVIGCCMGCGEDNKKKENTEQTTSTNLPKELNYQLIARHKHDITAFTEGLEFYKGKLIESTGSPDDLPNAETIIGIANLEMGKLEEKIKLDKKKYFGEGITILNERLYQLTYKNKTGFVYDANTYKRVAEFSYPSAEGWGLTNNGKELIMSDGSSTLTFIDPINYQVLKQLKVTRNGIEEIHINELEYVNGFIYANIWLKNYIIKINASNGEIEGVLSLQPLAQEAFNNQPTIDAMNGIAFNPANNHFYLTGKFWDTVYEIALEGF